MSEIVGSRIEILSEKKDKYSTILTNEALDFIAKLHEAFEPHRKELLKKRHDKQTQINKGIVPKFLEETKHIREDNWKADPTPEAIQDRRTEITGPVDRKMIINALNSGAKVFMADFEDANSPTFSNCIEGQINLRDAINRQIDFTNEKGKSYKLKEDHAILFVRPRGWHLVEKNIIIDGEPVSGSIVDFGLYFFHNAKALMEKGLAPYFYLPKLESHLEARLWNDIFVMAQNELGIPQGTIKATVLIETILAVFEMDEIIYELREHSCGLNAGRWDYIFSAIKKFLNYSDIIFPDRAQVGMTVPFMRAYAKLLVQTCHKRGVHAMGGMAAFIPSRKDEEVNKNAFAKVKADKDLEADTGFDGTWVAHPDLVAVAMESFNLVLGDKPNQMSETKSQSYQISDKDLIDFNIPEGKITEEGLRTNVNVAILYIEAWLRGQGAVAIYNLMEDAATAEISRAQVWQWLHNNEAILDDGRKVTFELYEQILKEEIEKIKQLVGQDNFENGRFDLAVELFDKLVKQDEFSDFLTTGAYAYI